MILTPKELYEDFENNKISKFKAYELLTSFVENNENESIREDSIKYLEKIGLFHSELFVFLENLLISDTNSEIRKISAQFLKKYFLDKSIDIFKWVLKNERELECLIIVIRALEQKKSSETKILLFNQLKNIIKTKYINKSKKIENKKYKSIIKKLLKSKKYHQFTHKELSDILINYFTIKTLIIHYPNVYYELNPQTGLVEELDLSDFLEFEVKGTPFGWKNNIMNISEITGLKFLEYIKKIDLSNNQIENVKDLLSFKKLTHIILANNKITKIKNIEFLKEMPNLVYIDLRYNKIIEKIKPKEFDENIRLILKDYVILK
jgi:hypothetical protein